MKKKLGTILIFVFVVAITWIVIAQPKKLSIPAFNNTPELNGWDELKKLSDRYFDEKGAFDLSGRIYLYDVEDNNVLKEKSNFRSIQSGDCLYNQLASQQTFVCDGWMIQLDTISRTIIAASVDREEAKKAGKEILPFGRLIEDSAMLQIKATLNETGEEGILSFKTELNPNIRSTSIYYNISNHSIRQTKIEWWKTFSLSAGNRNENQCWLSVIDFDDKKPTVMDIRESFNKVVTIHGTSIKPVGKYQDYKLVESINASQK
jgi:hypothetical protein